MVKIDPRFAPGLNNLGLALKRKGHWGVAVLRVPGRLADRSPVGPRPFQPRRNPGRQGRIDEAIDHYRQALGVDPDFALAHYYLGIALLAKGRRDEVDDCYPEGVKPLDQFRGPALGEAIAYYWQAYRL